MSATSTNIRLLPQAGRLDYFLHQFFESASNAFFRFCRSLDEHHLVLPRTFHALLFAYFSLINLVTLKKQSLEFPGSLQNQKEQDSSYNLNQATTIAQHNGSTSLAFLVLKNCRNVTLLAISILIRSWFVE